MFQQAIKNPSQVDRDWYLCSGRDDLIVPQYQEPSDQYLSQEQAFQLWQEHSKGLHMLGENPLNDYGGSNSESSPHGTEDWAEYQFEGLSGGTEQMNDNFFSSLLEENPPVMQNPYHLFGTPTNNLTKDLRYLEVPSFPLSMDGNKFDETPTFMLPNSEQRKGFFTTKAQVDTSPEADEHMDETSMEATTLQELETAMIQLKQETRISFRDALYRLANNSKQQHLQSQVQGGDLQEAPRFGEMDNLQSESNTFESTIAHLMFNNLNCDIQNLSIV